MYCFREKSQIFYKKNSELSSVNKPYSHVFDSSMPRIHCALVAWLTIGVKYAAIGRGSKASLYGLKTHLLTK